MDLFDHGGFTMIFRTGKLAITRSHGRNREYPTFPTSARPSGRAGALLCVLAVTGSLRWGVVDVDCDDAVAAYAGSGFWGLVNDDAHDWGWVLGEPDQPHPKVTAEEGMQGDVNRELPQIGHERSCTPGAADRDEPVGDLLEECDQPVSERVGQQIRVRGRPPRFCGEVSQHGS
jgi:hypothetical protein